MDWARQLDWVRQQDTRLAVIADLAARAPGGHLGRTALMKLCFLLQVVRGVPLGYRFTLYSYGPFDSSVLSDLNAAETSKVVASVLVYFPGGYGYQIGKGEQSDSISAAGRDFLAQYRASIDWVLDEFGAHGSADLELETTILYVDREARRKSEKLTVPSLALRVRDVKPHFPESYIREKAQQLHAQGLLQASESASAIA